MDLINDRTELHVNNLPNPDVAVAQGIPDIYISKDERVFPLPDTNDVVITTSKTGIIDRLTNIVYNLIK